MTRMGKCDVCRIRKVKCDEQRPKCGQCMKKNRPCRYDYSQAPKFVNDRLKRAATSPEVDTDVDDFARDGELASIKSKLPITGSKATILSIRSVKEAKQGHGVFHTFNTVHLGRNTELEVLEKLGPVYDARLSYDRTYGARMLHTPRSEDVSLCSRFTHLLGKEPAEWTRSSFLYGSWITLLPPRLGRNVALDDAASCFIAASSTYRGKSDDSAAVARKKYAKALLSLQDILTGADDDLRLSSETMAAVKLLLFVETMLEFRDRGWVSHSRGLINLLVERGPQVDADDITRSLFYATLPHDFVDAFLSGKDSAFVEPEWLHFGPPEYPTECKAFPMVYRVIMQQMIRLPKLIRLVREVRRNPSDLILGSEAMSLAEKLYLSNLGPIIDTALTDAAEWVPTEDNSLARYYPESLEFSAVSIFETLIRYCYCRILIIGLCKALKEVYPFSPVLDAAPLDSEDVQNATLIAVSVQYAEKLTEPLPIGPLLLMLPLQIAYGTWWRIERSEIGNQNGEARDEGKACFMKTWCLDKSNAMLRMWKGNEKSISKLEVSVAAMEGGPWMSWMERKPVLFLEEI